MATETKWIAIVNRVEARIYNAFDMKKLHTLKNSLGREKNRAFTTDKPGVGRGRTGSRSSTHAMTGEKKPHDDAAIQFARKINLFLQRSHARNKFGALLLTAEPRMKGWIKKGMDKMVEDSCKWQSKDLGHLSDHEVKKIFGKKKAV